MGLYLLVNMFCFPIESRPAGGHIEYASPHFYVAPVMAGYLAGTCISTLCSSHKPVNVFGAAALLSFGLAYAIYRQWFISVWCFFAAVLSVIVLLHFTSRAFQRSRAMDWLSENWVFLLVVVGMVAMHLFGHGGHGGHGGGRRDDEGKGAGHRH